MGEGGECAIKSTKVSDFFKYGSLKIIVVVN